VPHGEPIHSRLDRLEGLVMTGANILRRSGLALVLLLAAVAGSGAGAAQAPNEAASEWARGQNLQLGITQPALGISGQWRFERWDNGDIRIEKEENRRGRQTSGTVLVIGNGAIAVRGLRPAKDRELDEVNAPLSMLQLTMRLLERSAPGGPRSVARDVSVQVAEDKNSLKVTGIGAEGEFFAPWRARGILGPAGEGRVKFEFEFVSSRPAPGAKAYATEIAGIWERGAGLPPLPDSFPLTDWQVYQLRQVVKPRGQFNTVQLGVSPPMGFVRLGDLRARVAQWGSDAERRARYQCN